MNYYERAQELNEETIANRRYFHTNAEVGLDMPKAKAYVMKKLTEYGLEPKECGYGVTATLGHGRKMYYASCRHGCSSDAGRKWRTICMSNRKRSSRMWT